jgi:hypothetical protein
VSWGKVNPGVLPDTVVAYCDSTIGFPLFCEYAVGSKHGTRKRKELYYRRDELVSDLRRQGRAADAKRRSTGQRAEGKGQRAKGKGQRLGKRAKGKGKDEGKK